MDDALFFDAVLEESTNKLWGCHFSVPQTIALTLLDENKEKRVVCTLNGQIEYQCALIHRGDGTFLIMVNKKNQTKLGIKPGSRVQVGLRKDDSEYGLPMPEELAEVLAQDEDGNRLFHTLTPGKMRTLLYIVGQPKDSDARIRRALAVLGHLQRNQGKIDYKQLNLDIRAQI